MTFPLASSHFPHRVNENGMIDSICPRCFVTIGSSQREGDLAKMESDHVCDPSLLRYYEEQGQPKKVPTRINSPNSRRRDVAV